MRGGHDFVLLIQQSQVPKSGPGAPEVGRRTIGQRPSSRWHEPGFGEIEFGFLLGLQLAWASFTRTSASTLTGAPTLSVCRLVRQ